MALTKEEDMRVVKIVDASTVVINRGSNEGVEPNMRFLIYGLGGEIRDQKTGENLGVLELVRGEAKPLHIQEHMTTVGSSLMRPSSGRIVRKSSSMSILGLDTEEIVDPDEQPVPFAGACVGDCVRLAGR